MKKYLLTVLFMFSTNTLAGLFDEKMCSVGDVNSGKCSTGDVIFSGGSLRLAAMICDMDKQVSMSAKGFVCYYVGYKREQRK